MNLLQPLTMPLNGLNLIEASAGTGKTYTITTLYLRLLLGLADAEKVDDGLSVEQILVVTFTEAATEEIRDRVRGKLVEAKQAVFLADVEQNEVNIDPQLQSLVARLPDLSLAYRRLDAAIKMMDEAAIYTIHGFCQRMLKQHAFESGSLFDNEFILDQGEYLDKAVKDFWRCTVYPLTGTLLELFLECWKSPQALLGDLQGLLNKQGSVLLPDIEPAQLAAKVDQYAQLSAEVKSRWLDEQIPALINDANLLKSRKPAKAAYLEAFSEFCLSDELSFKKGKDSWGVWSQEAINKAMKKGAEPLVHPIFEQFATLALWGAQLQMEVKACYKHQAYVQLQQLLAREKRMNQKLSPDDLLTHLAQALADLDKGVGLGQKIAAQYPVAMIDEFQDTDPLQYGIFSAIYGTQTAEKSHTMVMIGDPKQAIYGFRGADIFTYIEAKQSVSSDARYTLATNWRSASNLIAGVNGLFTQAQDPFIYNQAIEFVEVSAATKADAEPLRVDGHIAPALQLWQLQSEDNLPINKAKAQQVLAVRSANEIVNLLDKGQQNQAFIGERPLTAGDICVLVRDRNEADVMRQALSRSGVSSVYLSRQSVFETHLAQDFYLLLLAIYEQKNERAIRAALITAFFNYDITQLWQLTEDEQQWQAKLDLFALLHQLWFKNGVMAVLQYLLSHHDLASLWKQTQSNPERMLTDIRHIGELLQQKSMELDGVHRLLGWFDEQLQAGKDEAKVQQLRLESDSNLVQIVTMHASKGLEYEVVFLPFVCSYRAAQSGVFHDERGLVIDFADEQQHLQLAEQERLAEDLRLLYVALTRGVHRVYMGIFNLKVGNSKQSFLTQTAVGYLLFAGMDNIDDAGIYSELTDLVAQINQQQAGVCQLESIEMEIEPIKFEPVGKCLPTYQLKPFEGVVEHDWKVTSYSALSYGVASVHVLPGANDEGSIEQTVDDLSGLVDLEPELSRFSFPKGANPGSCLHHILENIDLNCRHVSREVVAEALAQYGVDDQWVEVVALWLEDVLKTPLSKTVPPLTQLGSQDYLVEMEFYLPMERVTATQINELLSTHLKRKIEVFDFKPVKGVLKGYIDLTMVVKGKYYVVDHKSNHLGELLSDYGGESLEFAMDAHHYHLQYLLYSLALHRFLRLRIEGYDYQRHFGGCFYLFLRGMSQATDDFGGIYYARPSQALIEQLDHIFADEVSPDCRQEYDPQQLGLFGV